MIPLSTAGLLRVWEQWLKGRPPEWALALLETAFPDSSPEALADLSIGRRDAALLTLREWAFGQAITAMAVCAKCGQPMEMAFTTSALHLAGSGVAWPKEISLAEQGYTVRMRLPNSADLLACTSVNPADAVQQMFARCLIAAGFHGNPVLAEQLPDAVVDKAIEEMAKADPQANLETDIACVACGHEWREIFDIVSFFWTEIDAWAKRMLRDVHTLATAYGWSEREILSLSPLRRQCYLEMAGA